MVSFVLSHFTEGSDARRLTELLTLPPLDGAGGPLTMSWTVRIERTMLSERINKAHVLAPVVGALLGLWCGSVRGAGSCNHDTSAESESSPTNSIPYCSSSSVRGNGPSGDGHNDTGGRSSTWRDMLLDALLRHWDPHTEKQMAYLLTVDWRGALPTSKPGTLDTGARCVYTLGHVDCEAGMYMSNAWDQSMAGEVFRLGELCRHAQKSHYLQDMKQGQPALSGGARRKWWSCTAMNGDRTAVRVVLPGRKTSSVAFFRNFYLRAIRPS